MDNNFKSLKQKNQIFNYNCQNSAFFLKNFLNVLEISEKNTITNKDKDQSSNTHYTSKK